MLRNPLRAKLRQGQSTFGLWVTLESPNVTEAAVELGLDWVVIEMEHGHLDWREVIEHVRVVHRSETAPWCGSRKCNKARSNGLWMSAPTELCCR